MLPEHLDETFRGHLRGVVSMLCHVTYPGTPIGDIIADMDGAMAALFTYTCINAELPRTLTELQKWK